MKKQLLFISIVLIYTNAFAKIWLPSIFSDHMVLQQESEVTVWGWTTSTSEDITVEGSWSSEKITIKAYQGKWSLQLPTPKWGGPYTLTVRGHETVVFENILIGEVWVCSGQSNMEWTPKAGLMNAEEEIAAADYPNIRFFKVPKHTASNLQEDTPGEWAVCSPETMQDFSSVAYFFGRKLHKDLSIPIGLINTSWGGTPVETWLQKERIDADAELKEAAKKLNAVAWWPTEPGLTYNSMINPLLHFDIAGCIWYQGESNRVNATSYYRSFPLLITSWRKAWNKDFPFYFVQLAPFNYGAPNNNDVAFVRDAQLHTLKNTPKTGMAVTNDIGDLENIHPTNKQDVGKRLALWALAKTYGQKDLVHSGPIYKAIEITKNKATIHFDHSADGLIVKGKTVKEFFIAGEDQVFYPAKAKIKGHMVIVSAKAVKKPVAVRFAFTNAALPNLFNSAGLPASAFRTDNWSFKPDETTE